MQTATAIQRTILPLISLVVLTLSPRFLNAQERTTIEWQGRAVEVAKDQIALKVKLGVSSSTLSDLPPDFRTRR